MKIPLLANITHYSLFDFKSDLIAGVIVAVLTIPLSMGYAEVASMPPVYGLYAAFISALVFSLFTKTAYVVFGMDSATAAVTGSAMAGLGVVFGTQEAAAAMPFLGLLAAFFVIMFSILKAGSLTEKVPVPVMHGFILGITAVVLVGQIIKMLGITSSSTSALGKLIDLVTHLGDIQWLVVIFSILVIAALILITKYKPKWPAAFIVLVVFTAASAAMSAVGISIPTIGEISASVPTIILPSMPQGDFVQMMGIVADAFAIALVLSMETMLCMKVVNSEENSNSTKDTSNYDLGVAGCANAIGAMFACPPSAASLSRTVAVSSAGGKSQVASVIGAFIVLLSVFFLSPLISLIPNAVLAAIVAFTMVRLPDYTEIGRYAQHMKLELAVLIVVAVLVFAVGAVYGVIIGVIASLLVFTARKHGISSRKAVFGMADIDDGKEYKEFSAKFSTAERDEIIKCVKMGFGHRMFFSDAQSRIERAREILGDIPIEIPLLLGLTKLRVIDDSANDALMSLVTEEKDRGRTVYCIRKLALANDAYTRYELRRLFTLSDGVFPSKKIFEKEMMRKALGKKRKATEGPSWTSIDMPRLNSNGKPIYAAEGEFELPTEQPVVTLFIEPYNGMIRGRLIYTTSKETIRFVTDLADDGDEKYKLSYIRLSRRRTKEWLGIYENGKWNDGASLSKKELDMVSKTIAAAVTYPAFVEEFEGSKPDLSEKDEFEL